MRRLVSSSLLCSTATLTRTPPLTRATPTLTHYARTHILSTNSLTTHTYNARSFSTSFVKTPVLVLCEHSNGVLQEGTLHVVRAAQKLSDNIILLVAGGNGSKAVADAAAKISGVKKVLLAESPALDHGVAENVSPLLAALAKQHQVSHVLAATNAAGKSILPRVGAHLDVQPITDVVSPV